MPIFGNYGQRRGGGGGRWIIAIVIALIGVIGYSIELLMRWAERRLVPWRGKG